MNTAKLNTFEQYILQKINKDEFLRYYLKDVSDYNQYILTLFKEALTNNDAGVVQLAITISTQIETDSKLFVPALCKLLVEPWHYSHEDIAFWLKEISNTSATDCLYKAATLKFKYLDYDDTFQFARKCIKALASFKTEKAKAKLIQLASNENAVIAGYAFKELNKMQPSG